ncbi:MAG TPA: flagellar basal body P-ring protein FlgI, partial [bacterium]
MKTKIAIFAACIVLFGPILSQAQVRIKDVAAVEGSSGRSVVGYGLVVGLNGTGD